MKPTFRAASIACVVTSVLMTSFGLLHTNAHAVSDNTHQFLVGSYLKTGPDQDRLVQYLRHFGLRLDRVLTMSDDVHALLADSGEVETTVLMLLKVTPDSVFPVAEAEQVGRFVPKFNRWLRLGAPDVNAFYYRQPYASEAFEGATVLYRGGDQFTVSFRDAPDACKSAELKDLDGDDVPELVEHVEHPHGRFESCISDCDIDLEVDFSVHLSWQRVHRWTGSEWSEAEDRYPAFYAELARRYQRAAVWAADSSESWSCGVDGAAFLREWSDRANQMSVQEP